MRVTTTGHVFIGLRITGIGEVVDVEESLGESVEESQPAPVVTPAVAALVAVTGRLHETHKRRKGKR